MPDHLRLPQPRPVDSRRRPPGGGDRDQPQPGRHGAKLTEQLDSALEKQRPMRTIEGVDPASVFKLRAQGTVADATLGTHGLRFLGETAEWTYIVLAPGDDPETLRDNLREYAAAEADRSRAPNRTFFEAVVELLPYGRDDRRGPGLPPEEAALGESLVVDVVVWPSPDFQTAVARLADVRAVLEAHDVPLLGYDDRARYTIARARVDRACLDDLLDLPVVELVRMPPMPRLEPTTWRGAGIEDLPEPTVEQGSPLGADRRRDHEPPVARRGRGLSIHCAR